MTAAEGPHVNGTGYSVFAGYHASPAVNRLEQQQYLDLVHNELTTRREWLSKFLDPKRDLEQECGFPTLDEAVPPNLYKQLFERDPISARVVECEPKESWQAQPSVYEDEDEANVTQFEEAWDNLGSQLNQGSGWYSDEEGSRLWEYLMRGDVASRIGSYGILLLGFQDGRPLDEPVAGCEEMMSRIKLDRSKDGRVKSAKVEVKKTGPVKPDSVMTPDEEKGLGDGTQTGRFDFKSGTTNSTFVPYNAREKAVIEKWRQRRVAYGQYVDAFNASVSQGKWTQKARQLGQSGTDDSNPNAMTYGAWMQLGGSGYAGSAPTTKGSPTAAAGDGRVRDPGSSDYNDPTWKDPTLDPDDPRYDEQDVDSQPDDPTAASADDADGDHPGVSPDPQDGATGGAGQVDPSGPNGPGAPGADGAEVGDPTGLDDPGTDGTDMSQDVGGDQDPTLPPHQAKFPLIYVRPYDESQVQVVRYEWDPQNPRFGHPVIYRVTLNDPREQYSGIGLPINTVFVHWTRVVHLADKRLSSDVFGRPAMRQVLNNLLGLRKVYLADPEAYWKSCFTIISLETNPQTGGDVDVNMANVRQMMQNVMNSSQRWMVNKGLSAKPIAPAVVDPTPHIAVQVEAICIVLGVPVRVFKGSERGELASSQDDASWNDRLKARQDYYLTPCVIVPFVDRMIACGVLPEPQQGYGVSWPDLDSLTDKDRATVCLTNVQALTAWIAGNGESALPLESLLTHPKFFGMDREEAGPILDGAQEVQQQQLEDQQALADQQGFQPDAPDGFHDPTQEDDQHSKDLEKIKAYGDAGMQPPGQPPGLGQSGGASPFPPKPGGGAPFGGAPKPPGPPKPPGAKPNPFARNQSTIITREDLDEVMNILGIEVEHAS